MTTFHVRHDFHPSVAREALLLLRTAPLTSEQDFLAFARSHDFDIGRRQSSAKVFASLRDLGLLDRPSRHAPLRLTSLGQQLAEIALRDELLWVELIHLRYWWLWTPETGGEGFAWAYQAVTSLLWEEAPTTIDVDRLVAMVIAGAEKQFGVKGASFSASSVLGIMHWLRALSPTCCHGSEFHHRSSCSPEALLLTLEAIATLRNIATGAPLRLDEPTRQRACRALLIDGDTFDDMVMILHELGYLIRRTGDGGDTVLLRTVPVVGLAPQRMAL